MNDVLKLLGIAVAALVVVGVLYVGGVLFLLTLADQSTYASEGVVVEGVDYDRVLVEARAAGYAVERGEVVGYHPEGVTALDGAFGPDYRLARIVVYHENATWLEALTLVEAGTELSLFSVDGPSTAANAPPEAWLTDRIALLLGIDRAAAREHARVLLSRIGDEGVPGVAVDGRPDLAAAHDALVAASTRTDDRHVPGGGWVERRYLAGDERVGRVDCVVAHATVTLYDDGHRYEVGVDRLGGVEVLIHAAGGEELPEAEYRGVLRTAFERMGLPPGAVDRLEFDYDPSVW